MNKIPFLLFFSTLTLFATETWTTKGFQEFRKGTFENGGDNLYVSRQGILQRIRQSDLNGDGEQDILICNAQGHEEYVYPQVFHAPLQPDGSITELQVGGVSSAIAVGDVNHDGYDDVVMACGWDGQEWSPCDVLYYGSPEGISNRYIRYLPVSGGRPVIGDFDKNGTMELAFVYGNAEKGKIVLLSDATYNVEQEIEFSAPEFQADGSYILSVLAVPDIGGDAILARLTNGAVIIFRNDQGKLSGKPHLLLAADATQKEEKYPWSDSNQFVPPPKPQLRKIMLYGKLYIFVPNTTKSLLIPYANGKLDITKALAFDIHRGMTVSASPLADGGYPALAFAAQDNWNGQQCSWIYLPDAKGNYAETNRLPIPSQKACDILLANFGGTHPSLLILEGNSGKNYDGKTLFYPVFSGKESIAIPPKHLPSGDARILLAPNMKGRRELIIPHTRTGNTTGFVPVSVYFGKDGDFSPENAIHPMGNGAMDGLFVDVDDDGKPDLILANQVEMSPHLNDGSYIYYADSNWKTAQKLWTDFPASLLVSDFDRDGFLDMIFPSSQKPELTFYHGKGNRQYEPQTISLPKGFSTLWIASGDLNADGFVDLVLPSGSTRHPSCILWGTATGFSYDNRTDLCNGEKVNAQIADLNGDGYPEILLAGSYPNPSRPHDSYVHIYYGSAEGYSDFRCTMLPCNNADSLQIGDFNNDGLLDIFVGAYDNKLSRELESHIYWNDAKDGFTRNNRMPIRTEASCGAICGDFNHDGWLDLALANHKVKTQHDSFSQVWFNDHGRFSQENTTKLPSSGVHGMIHTDSRNMMTRSASETYVSAPYETKKIPKTLCATLDAQYTGRSSVKMQLRSAENTDLLKNAPWQNIPIGTQCSAKDFPGKFFQYKLELTAPNGIGTPRIKQVTIDFADR